MLPGNALAVPALQLDVEGGWYNFETETVVIGQGEPFIIYAILTEKNQAAGLDNYYLSVALVSSDGTPIPDTDPIIGSYYIDTDINDGLGNGTTVDVTGDMVYGVPPLEEVSSLDGSDPGDLQTHDVFLTYYNEYAFTFSASQTTATYNAGYDVDDPDAEITAGGIAGGGLIPGEEGSYYWAFYVDATDLPGTEYNLHFDLYSEQFGRNAPSGYNDIDRDLFAPFSHDAQSVPEPDTLLLFGSGILLAGIFFKKRKRTTPKDLQTG